MDPNVQPIIRKRPICLTIFLVHGLEFRARRLLSQICYGFRRLL